LQQLFAVDLLLSSSGGVQSIEHFLHPTQMLVRHCKIEKCRR
jgi:hypothetical protein